MESAALRSGFWVLQKFRAIDPEMPMVRASIFLTVAANPGIAMKEVRKRLNIPQATCSRNVSILSPTREQDKPGLGLVVATEDPVDSRRKVVHLTHKGELMAKSIEEWLLATGYLLAGKSDKNL